MAHMFESGFTVRKPAWHGLADVYDDNPQSVEQALQWAGADWEPIGTPVFAAKESHQCQSKEDCAQYAAALVMGTDEQPIPSPLYACGTHANVAKRKGLNVKALSLRQLGDYYAVIRSDNSDVLNVARDSYELFTNKETAELVQLLLDPDAGAKGMKVEYETGGVLKGGKLVWFLARLNEPMEVNGDTSPIYPYISVLNSHDGSAALRAINTSVRIVCWNTWSAAENQAESSGREFSFRHTASIRDRVDDARKVLLGARDDTAEWVEYANRMVAIPITDSQFDTFLQDFVPMPPKPTDRSAANVEEARGAIKKFYHSASCASIAGTAWGAIQAAGEYLDHGRTWRSRETYVSRQMLRPEQGKKQAIKLIEDVVGVS